jgi:hypothetical protein
MMQNTTVAADNLSRSCELCNDVETLLPVSS